MPRFFISESDIKTAPDGSRVVTVREEDARHISASLRMATDDKLIVCDEKCTEYECVIKSISDKVELEILSSRPSVNEPPYKAVVYQALIKGDKFDSVVQKAVECGASSIVPFVSSRCIAKLNPDNIGKKVSRWQKIAYEAAKQCGRGIIPSVASPQNFSEMISSASKCALPLFCYEESKTNVKQFCCSFHETISVVIGPEGGFSKEEAYTAAESGMKICSLGSRILRTETAAGFMLSCLSYEYEM